MQLLAGITISSLTGTLTMPRRKSSGIIAAQAAQPAAASNGNLLSAPIELAGDWGNMLPTSALRVLDMMRESCLRDTRLLSDRQPQGLRVERRPSGPPAIWLHKDEAKLAWVFVNVGERDWSRLAYQFGHELGHVFANSWTVDSKPARPSQWIEESMVEAFSLYGLKRLAAEWTRNPPFKDDNPFGDKILKYQERTVRRYAKLAEAQGLSQGSKSWFERNRKAIEGIGLNTFGQAMSIRLASEYEQTPGCLEALGALNRWPERSHLATAEYLDRWTKSCNDLGASTHLPATLKQLLLGQS